MEPLHIPTPSALLTSLGASVEPGTSQIAVCLCPRQSTATPAPKDTLNSERVYNPFSPEP